MWKSSRDAPSPKKQKNPHVKKVSGEDREIIQAKGPQGLISQHSLIQYCLTGRQGGFTSLGCMLPSVFSCSCCTHLLSLYLLCGEGSFLVHIKSFRPEGAVTALGWCGCHSLTACLLMGHARGAPVAPQWSLQGLTEAPDGPILHRGDEVRQRGDSGQRPHALSTGFLCKIEGGKKLHKRLTYFWHKNNWGSDVARSQISSRKEGMTSHGTFSPKNHKLGGKGESKRRDYWGVDFGSDWLAYPGLQILESLEATAVGHIMGKSPQHERSTKTSFCLQPWSSGGL